MTEKLTKAQMAKVRAARRFTVDLTSPPRRASAAATTPDT